MTLRTSTRLTDLSERIPQSVNQRSTQREAV